MAEETRQTTEQIEARSSTGSAGWAGSESAHCPIEAGQIIRFSAEDERQIAEALLSPSEPTLALTKAFQRRRELLGVE